MTAQSLQRPRVYKIASRPAAADSMEVERGLGFFYRVRYGFMGEKRKQQKDSLRDHCEDRFVKGRISQISRKGRMGRSGEFFGTPW